MFNNEIITNEDRADSGRVALGLFSEMLEGPDRAAELREIGTAIYGGLYDEPQTVLVDLLADLMHLCASDDDLNFDSALDTARMHFETEVEQGG